jgi:ATP-dependent Zn protease
MHQLLYIDPGSGSYLVQVIVAGALGVAFFFKNIVLYVRHFFYRLFGKKDKKP